MRDRPYPGEMNMWDRGTQGVGGMFGGLQRATNPYANRMMLTGMGMLSGKNAGEGWEGAMKGLVAGSALDTERKREKALQGLMDDPDSNLMAGFSEKERAAIAGDPELARAVLASKMKSGGTEWRRLSDDSLFNERTGEVKPAGSGTGAGGSGSFLKGNAAEVQAARFMVDNGKWTEEQAAQWLASKTITGPNGETLLITPDQLINAAGMKDGQAAGGGPIQITGGKMTEEQRKAKGFHERAAAADAIVGDPAISAAGQGAWDKGASSILPEGIAPYVTSTESQQFRQARDDFINANLRRESGAAISPKEYADADRIFFPHPGEPEEVVAQKAAARLQVIRGLQESYEPVPISPGGGQTEDPLGLR